MFRRRFGKLRGSTVGCRTEPNSRRVATNGAVPATRAAETASLTLRHPASSHPDFAVRESNSPASLVASMLQAPVTSARQTRGRLALIRLQATAVAWAVRKDGNNVSIQGSRING